MASLKNKVENGLNETRILVLGIQILIGFSFRGFFEPGFEKMADYAKAVQLASLGLMLFALGTLLIPVPYHRALHGRNIGELHRMLTATISVALLPFAVAMALSMFLGALWVTGARAAVVIGCATLAVAGFFWYGFELALRKRRSHVFQLSDLLDPLRGIDMNEEEHTDLTTRIQQAFIESRVVLPGAQALLGFQLIIMWMSAFYRIPHGWQLLHLACLASTTVCTVLLIAPAAHHRIVERGDDSEELHHFISQMLLAAMVFLGLGVGGDFYLVARLTGLGALASGVLLAALMLFFVGAWFVFPYWRTRQLPRRETRSHMAEHRVA